MTDKIRAFVKKYGIPLIAAAAVLAVTALAIMIAHGADSITLNQ